MSSKEMEKEIKRYLDIQAERFTHDLGFVIDEVKAVEERLNKKIELEIRGLRKELTGKIDSVMTELIAHRDNTEMHVQKAKRKKKAS